MSSLYRSQLVEATLWQSRDLLTLSAPSVLECCARCQATSACVAVKYDRDSSVCQMSHWQNPGSPFFLWNALAPFGWTKVLIKKQLTSLGGKMARNYSDQW